MQQRSILIGPPSQRPILESLLDLSAAGALEAFTWIEAGSDPASEADREDPRALRIADGQISSTTFSKSVNVRRLARLRIVILVPVGHPDADALTASAENFYQSLDIPGGASRVFVRVLIPWSAEPIAAELGRPGWNDVMLSPEGTAEPEFAAVPWWNDPLSIPGAAAAGVAVQAGLLPGLDEAPADDEKPGMSTDVPLARTFIRRIDAEAVESALKERVLRIDEQVPAPTRSTGSSVPPYASPENLIRDTAAVWTTRHEPSVRRPGPQIPQPDSETIGFGEAIKLFISFLLRALIGAPEAWLRKALHSAQSTVAAGTTAMIFGKESPVGVIVGGVAADGSTATWRTIRDAAKAVDLGAGRDAGRLGQPARRDFSALWADMLQGGRALLDASACQNLELDSAAGYIPRREMVAPELDGDGVYEITEALGEFRAPQTLRAWDHLEIERSRHVLERAAGENDTRAASARRHLEQIDRWRARNESRFLPLLGRTLGEWFTATRQEIAGTQDALRGLLMPTVDEALGRAQRRLAWVLRGLAVLAVIVVIVLGILGWRESITLQTMAISMGVTALVWLLASLIVIVLLQREVFRLLHLQRQRDLQVPALTERLRMAIEDLDALGDAYAQFDRWALLMTGFLAEPLGRGDESEAAERPSAALPAALQMPTVDVAPSAIDEAAAHLRADVFTVGWLGEAFEDFEKSMTDDLTPEQRVRMSTAGSSPLALLLSSRADPGSELSLWAEGTVEHGVRSGRGDEIWSRCSSRLDDEELLDLTFVRDDGGGRAESVSVLRSELWKARSASIVEEVLELSARTADTRIVDPGRSWRRSGGTGLSSDFVLVQRTPAVSAEAFVYPRTTPLEHRPAQGQDATLDFPDDLVF